MIPNPLPVIVADARSFMRGCLVCWLRQFGRDFHPFATADAVRAVGDWHIVPPAAVILGASSDPEGSAWLKEQAAGLHRLIPDVPIIVLIDETAVAVGRELALSIGSQGFIPMSSSLNIALAALQLVAAGGKYFPNLVETPASAMIPAPGAVHAGVRLQLTPREQAVCALLSEGHSNKVIARKLGMAVSTVKIHVHHILKKLAVESRTAVAVRVTVELASETNRTMPLPRSGYVLANEAS